MVTGGSVPTVSLRSILEKDKLTGTNFLNWYRTCRIVLWNEKKMYILEGALPTEHPTNAARAVRDAWLKHQNDDLEVSCLMLGTISPELQRQFEGVNAFGLLEQLKIMFQEHARVEKYNTLKNLLACRMTTGQSVSAHVLKMKGHLEELERAFMR
ncbi:PREDICTED: coiled-coil domain-containing protein 103-like [Tarenaya hassleriana]|uniref:coiled-coil domain-containing protein 103-like n=1 Tax=Tarenaya hassleriana TaxID=28532 RepID=UPI0008FCEC4D|nr:PREDICTED: coiled-coil domain-containing protein 103-like [Tarenaya hassleriana]